MFNLPIKKPNIKAKIIENHPLSTKNHPYKVGWIVPNVQPNLSNANIEGISTEAKFRESNKKLGILVNFNTDKILDSIKRIVNKLED